jgi:leader peptidase (prepilin peptidase)/N-methyltransferase
VIAVGAVGAAMVVTAVGLGIAGVGIGASAAIATLVPAAAIDVRHRRLPDGYVLAAGAVLMLAGLVSWAALGTSLTDQTTRAGLGALVMAAPLVVVHLASPASMGFGDVKVAVVLGAAVGTADWRLGLVALALATGTASLVGLVRRAATMPFGPFLVGGSAGAVLLGATVGAAIFGVAP